MSTAILDAKTKTHEFDVEDVEYLRHGGKPLRARIYRPEGEGPFPETARVLENAAPNAAHA